MPGIAARSRARARGRHLLALLSAVALVVTGWSVGAASARAADGTATVVDSVTFQQSTFQDQSVQTLAVDWHAAESPATPTVQVQFDLPAELIGQTATFSIGNGTCVITNTNVTCTIDDSYIEQNPYNVHGSFELGVQVDLDNHETVTGKTFTIGGVVTNPVDVTSRYCQTNCEFGGTGAWKGGSYDNGSDRISWTVQVPDSGEGIETATDGKSMAAGQSVTVTDTFAGNDFTVVGGPTVQVAGCLVTDQWGYQSPVYNTVPAGDVTVSGDSTSVTFTTAAGGCSASDETRGSDPTPLVGTLYRVSWTVHANDLGKGVTGPGQYQNTATISVGGQDSSVTGSATRRSYGGTAVGENFGRLELKKAFDADADVLLPASISVAYTISYPDDTPAPQSGTITLDAGNGWQFLSDEIFKGATVTLSEANPGPSNVDWRFVLTDADGDVVSQGVPGADGTSYSFVVAGDTISSFTLTNSASLEKQQVAAKKTLENPDGVTLPDGTAFQLQASWPENQALAIKAGSASVELPADGSTVSFPGLPVGADVTFTETAPDAIPGATWESSSVSPANLTIGDDSRDVTVTATNALSRNVGTFSVAKTLTGEAAGLVTDKTFEVGYSYPADPALGIEAGSGTVKVTADGEPATVTAPAGAVVTLSEQPVKVEGGTWAQPAFDPGATFTVEQDQNVAIALTNLLTLDTGDFTLRKVVAGSGASLLPAGTEFTVHYSYPAGTGFAAGEGDLTVGPNGTVSSPRLPYGAVVSLAEDAPETVKGATWSAPEFSRSTVTIGDDTTVAVTLTNTLITDPSPSLASTGSTVLPWVAVPGFLLILGGLLVLMLRRRRRQA